MRANLKWWDENHSKRQANRWFQKIQQAIATLDQMPARFSLAPEAETLGIPLHQMSFGVSTRPTHRVLYTTEGNFVKVLRVMHGSQKEIRGVDELA